MAEIRKTTYDVQFYQGDHWVSSNRFETEAGARTYGQKALSGGKIEGFRVIREWRRADGCYAETQMHEEFRAASSAITLSPIDEAPRVCLNVQDTYRVESRIMMNRLLRGYVERAVVTPTEIMHHYQELKHLLSKDSLTTLAISHIASLQAEICSQDIPARRSALHGFMDKVTQKARHAATRKDLPDISPSGFGPVYATLNAQEAPEECDFYARVVLSRDLAQKRNWLAKLDFLMELLRIGTGLAGAPLMVLDGMMADVLGAPSVAQDLLGMQHNLAQALCSLIDLACGRLAPSPRGGDERALLLSELLGGNALDETKLVILDLVRRQIKGTQLLNRHDPSAERDTFDRVLARVMTIGAASDGMISGGMAEALVLRYMRFLEAGGAVGRRQAINEMLARFPDVKDRVRFLLALASSNLGKQESEAIVAKLQQLTSDRSTMAGFVDRNRPIKSNLEQLTRLYMQVVNATMVEQSRRQIADNIDDVLCAYITSSRLVELMDNPNDPLRRRAYRLIQLCTPGTLRSPKALGMARQRVLEQLRQPDFERRYVEDVADLATQTKILRDFFKMLNDAGFQ